MSKVYVASPLGFAESTRDFLVGLNRLLTETGHDVFDPWSQPAGDLITDAQSIADCSERLARLRDANYAVARANEFGIRESQAILAVLDGVDVDSGTASEIGVAFALQKVIFGLRTDFRKTGDNDAATVNLQVQYFIEASGGEIFRSLSELKEFLETRTLGAVAR